MSEIIVSEGSSPSNPSSGKGKFYADSSDSQPYYLDDAGRPLLLAGVVIREDGLLEGTATDLNFTGSGVEVSISGTHIDVTIAGGGGGGGGGGQIGIMNWDDGAPLGTGTVIDWGQNIDASLSGNVVAVSSVLGVYEDGGLQGSVPNINFVGTGVEVGVSGSYAEITIAGNPGPFTGVDQIGIYNLDEGIPLGTGTTVDWGTNLDLSLSGTTLRVDSVLAVYEDGGLQGSVPNINFVGDGVEVSVSGTYAEITIAGGGGGGGGGGGEIGVMHWDDGVPIATGTIIDWEDNLEVSVSGTVARARVIDAPVFVSGTYTNNLVVGSALQVDTILTEERATNDNLSIWGGGGGAVSAGAGIVLYGDTAGVNPGHIVLATSDDNDAAIVFQTPSNNTAEIDDKGFNMLVTGSIQWSSSLVRDMDLLVYSGASGTPRLYYDEDQVALRQTTRSIVDGGIIPRVVSITTHTAPSIDTNITDIFRITNQGSTITSFTTNLSGAPWHGQKLIVEILDNGTGRAITWGASFRSTDVGTLPTTTIANKLLRVGFMYDSADAIWECVAVSNEA